MIVLSVQGDHGVEPVDLMGRWRVLRDQASAPKELTVSTTPFLIGRGKDCNLILPEDLELRASTSRWHAYLIERNGLPMLGDGSYYPHPDTGRIKPSVTGTLLNSQKISAPEELRDGDQFQVGPWRFSVRIPEREDARHPDAVDILRDIANKATGRRVDEADPKLKEKFGQLHELVCGLARIPDIDQCLAALLVYAVEKMKPAEVAAILLARPDKGFDVRMAWERRLGRVSNFRFSASLLASLPPDQAFLLQAKLKDPSLSQSVHDISSGLLVPLWGKGERLGVFYLDNRRSGATFTEEDLFLASAIASLISLQLTLERQSHLSKVEANMSRYFAPDVVQRIVEKSFGDEPVGLDVQEKNVSVLFVDMEGFTAMSREKTPRQLSEILNPYFEVVARALQAGGGHVNKFIGDAVMGIFAAQPGEEDLNPAEYAQRAVRSGLAIFDAWAAEARKRGLPQVRLRIGINSGRAVVGNIGYAARLEYSVLGEAVNIASRLEKLAPPGRVAVSEETRRLSAGIFDFEDFGEHEVKGVGKMQVFLAKAAESTESLGPLTA